MSWWITFSTPFDFHGQRIRAACVDGGSEADAIQTAAEYAPVLRVFSLPYPAEPRLTHTSACPSFCYAPTTCAGRTACPKSYACSE